MKTLTTLGLVNIAAMTTTAFVLSPKGALTGAANILNPVRGIASCFGAQPTGKQKAAETLMQMAIHQAACAFIHEHTEWRDTKGFWLVETVVLGIHLHELYTAGQDLGLIATSVTK